MKKAIVWGTGKIAIKKKEEVCKYYDLVAYCDSNSNKWGCNFQDRRIISPAELYGLLERKSIDIILIAVKDEKANKEIIEKIKQDYLNEIEVLEYKEWGDKYEKEYLKYIQQEAEEKWDIPFEKQLEEWVDNLESETEFWLNQVVKKGNQAYYDDYLGRQKNQSFGRLDNNISNIEAKIKDGDIVLDVGAGVWSKYGTTINNGEITLVPVDPLAYYYNKINDRYASVRPRKCKFGLFEFLSLSFEKESANFIIINNALDHCIDPYRSIIQCVYVLKTGGILHLYHRRAEALYENWSGLHKWNVDYKNDDFTLWNLKNYLNVSKRLKEIAEIKITPSDESVGRAEEFLMVEITKLKDFDINDYLDVKNDERYLMCLLEKIMHKYLDEMSWL